MGEKVAFDVLSWRPGLDTGDRAFSEDGRVMSMGRERLVKPRMRKDGSRIVVWTEKGRRRQRDLHRCVWEAWVGPVPEGSYVTHVNGRKWDNRLRNLRLTSMSEISKKAWNRRFEAWEDLYSDLEGVS